MRRSPTTQRRMQENAQILSEAPPTPRLGDGGGSWTLTPSAKKSANPPTRFGPPPSGRWRSGPAQTQSVRGSAVPPPPAPLLGLSWSWEVGPESAQISCSNRLAKLGGVARARPGTRPTDENQGRRGDEEAGKRRPDRHCSQ